MNIHDFYNKEINELDPLPHIRAFYREYVHFDYEMSEDSWLELFGKFLDARGL